MNNSQIGRYPMLVSFAAGIAVALVSALVVTAHASAPRDGTVLREASQVVRDGDVPRCARDDFGQVGAIEAPGKKSSKKIGGTRSKVWIPPKKTRCQRIGSIYVYSKSESGLFEFGYVVGYFSCSRQTYHRPRLFYYARSNRGGSSCYVFGRLPKPRQFDTLTGSDKNGNTVWGAYFNGHQLQPDGVDLDFKRGKSLVAVERATRRDSSKAKFNKIRKYLKGRWTRWDRLTRTHRTDVDFKMKRVNAYTGHVIRQ